MLEFSLSGDRTGICLGVGNVVRLPFRSHKGKHGFLFQLDCYIVGILMYLIDLADTGWHKLASTHEAAQLWRHGCVMVEILSVCVGLNCYVAP